MTWKESKVSGGAARAGRRRERRGRGRGSLTEVQDHPQKVYNTVFKCQDFIIVSQFVVKMRRLLRL